MSVQKWDSALQYPIAFNIPSDEVHQPILATELIDILDPIGKPPTGSPATSLPESLDVEITPSKPSDFSHNNASAHRCATRPEAHAGAYAHEGRVVEAPAAADEALRSSTDEVLPPPGPARTPQATATRRDREEGNGHCGSNRVY